MNRLVRAPALCFALCVGLCLGLGIGLGSPAAWAAGRPSFDCAKARSPVEKAICADGALADQDASIGNRFGKARKSFDAATAKDFGLVNRVVPSEYLNQIVMKYAQTIASKSPSTLKLGKEAFYKQAEMGLADAYDYASRVMVENLLGGDAKEGISAFIEKRKPEWSGE